MKPEEKKNKQTRLPLVRPLPPYPAEHAVRCGCVSFLAIDVNVGNVREVGRTLTSKQVWLHRVIVECTQQPYSMQQPGFLQLGYNVP